MPEDKEHGEAYLLIGLIIIGIFVILIIREIRHKTKIMEVVRDERGNIREIIEKSF